MSNASLISPVFSSIIIAPLPVLSLEQITNTHSEMNHRGSGDDLQNSGFHPQPLSFDYKYSGIDDQCNR